MFSTEEITGWVGSAMWVLVRVTALIAAAPILGSRTVPVKIKLGLALVLTMVLLPIVPKAPSVDPLSASALLITVNQIIIGVAMGLALQLREHLPNLIGRRHLADGFDLAIYR